MRELGRAGGKASVRRRLGLDLGADESLRAKARRRLEAQLDSDDERLAQAAARALYSYGPAKPPADAEQEALRHPDGLPHRGVTIARILEIAIFEAQGAVDDELADVVLRSAAKVRELEAAGKLAPTFRDVLMEDAVDKFTANIERLADRRQNDVPSDLASLERKRNDTSQESLSRTCPRMCRPRP